MLLQTDHKMSINPGLSVMKRLKLGLEQKSLVFMLVIQIAYVE